MSDTPLVVEIKIPNSRIRDQDHIDSKLDDRVSKMGYNRDDFTLIRRSIDSRSKEPIYVLRYQKKSGHEDKSYLLAESRHTSVRSSADEVVIVGAGPAGYFAALELLKLGLKPIILDRGKDVRERRRDLRRLQQFSEVNPNSNYCFGEGGAGTYSDGKLYTRAKKRGSVMEVLHTLVHHGADTDILVDAHPHIGSNNLPKIIANIRQTILDAGGEIHFETQLTDIRVENGRIQEIEINKADTMKPTRLILATGHSARDIYAMLVRNDIEIAFKPFAVGVRIEHPQPLIDQIQYGYNCRPDTLPAASYSLVHSHKDIGVYSFCMCPGGLVVPAATQPGEIVLNGMSLSRRDSPFANAGTVVTIGEKQLTPYRQYGALAGVMYQQEIERNLFNFGDGSQRAPSQRLVDFVQQKASHSIPATSYIPGNYSAPLHDLLPDYIFQNLARAIPQFEIKMRGYLTNEAVVMATESRTSSPVSIPRDPVTLMHTAVRGLYPCGEGAGYAGGIMSAAMDGIRVAHAIKKNSTTLYS